MDRSLSGCTQPPAAPATQSTATSAQRASLYAVQFTTRCEHPAALTQPMNAKTTEKVLAAFL